MPNRTKSLATYQRATPEQPGVRLSESGRNGAARSGADQPWKCNRSP